MAWRFLSQLRKICLSISLLLAILILLQTISGKLESIELFIWGWFAGLALPIIVLLWVHKRLYPYPGTVLSKKTYYFVITGILFYYLSLLIIILLEPFYTQDSLSILGYYTKTFWGFLLFEILLIIPLVNLLFRKESAIILEPDEIQRFAQQSADRITIDESYNDPQGDITPEPEPNKSLVQEPETGYFKSKKNYKKRCYNLIAINNLEECFSIMRRAFEKKRREEDIKYVVLLQRQYVETIDHREKGFLSFQDSLLIINRITLGTLEMVGAI
ncbi:MAG: hypothetical protein ACKVU0_02625 [Saprospiraceae bacterium]